MLDLTGKVALVTGGTSGIGRATAIAFAQQGAKVVVAGRRVEEGEKTVELLEASGGEGFFIQTDVTSEVDVKAMIEKTTLQFGQINYAFNNAGIFGETPSLIDQTQEEYEHVMNANVKSVWLSMKYEIAQMLKQGSGAIVNNSSVLGVIGNSYVPLYIASKHAVLGLTRGAALQYAKTGIRINAVAPGAIDTDMFEQATGGQVDAKTQMAGLHPIGRVGKAAEIAQAVIWLCSEGASFVTGQALMVDGGFTAQ
ncbi:SDR family oxidoreductase [Leptolyngbya sp. FACHB-321]|uniref:SDR family oxidoreductase n=1 Tax=Leptolyngbya sp. FACHB-321 TaxID=2692807 RepID=UPI001687DE98|nr:SDR family oxidoreductase [Leptolyngbya sp. FACHB-321]MBD2034546.1 SDR family oxidoreductase [Leptolyngbya sp. FACHB-321]